MATRKAIKACLDATGESIPGVMPGSADLTGNTGMAMADATAQSVDEPGGSLIHYGIREHGMGGVMNGMAAHRGVLPVGGTFFVFSDYMRGAVRIAALSDVHVVYSWTHDSIGLGQDGPTHQPIEQLAAVRAMPNLRVIRPADANETAQAWRIAVDSDGPTALILSRQELPVLAETAGTGRSRGVPGGLRAARARGRRGPGGAHRHRQRGAAVPGRRRPARRQRACRPGWSPSRRGTCSPTSPRSTGARCSRAACPAWPWRRPAPSAGSATPTPPCASTTSAPRLRGRWPWRSSASPPSTSPPRPPPWWPGGRTG